MIHFHLIFIQLTYVYRERLFNSLIGWSWYSFHLFNLLILDITIIDSFIGMGIIIAGTGMSILFHVNNRIRLNISRIACLRIARWSTISRFIREDIQNFRMIFLGNHMYGRILAVFILVNTPCNAYILIRVISQFDSLNNVTRIAGLTILAEQYTCIGLLHIFLAKSSLRVHRSPQPLFSLMVMERNRIRSISNRIRVDLTIARLHTNNRYGITYGKLSLITMQSFAKVNLQFVFKNVLKFNFFF